MLLETDCGKLHHSHLFQYISAWECCPEMIKEMEDRINAALIEAKLTVKSVYVDFDGEMELQITPAGYIILMLPWKTYKVVKEN